jgi:hypothetical protein
MAGADRGRDSRRLRRRRSQGAETVVVNTDSVAELQAVRDRHRSWAIVRMDDGSYRAMREWWGNQQIIRVPTHGELDARLKALPPGNPVPPSTDNPRKE